MNGEERLKYLLKKLIGSKEFTFSERNWQKMKTMLPDNEPSGEEQFKTSLNKLIEEKEFPFSESNWKKMSALLPVRERKNRLVPIMWAAAAGLLVVGTFLVVNHKSEVVSQELKVSEVQSSKLKVESLKKEVSSSQKSKVKSHRSQVASRKSENIFSENVVKEKVISSEIPVISDVQEIEKEFVKEEKEISVPDVLVPVVVNEIENEKKEEEIKQEESPKSQVVSRQLATNELSNFQTFEQQDTVKETSPQTEVVSQQLTESSPPIELPKKTKKPFMYFEAGGDYLLGWKNTNKKEGNGFNPVVGFNYYNYLNEKMAVSLGAQYTSVNNLNDYNNTSKIITHYTFGEESQVTIITPQKAHYLLVPIKLNYFLDTLNSFGIGFNTAYLLTVSGQMETYTIHLNKKENYKSGKVNGYAEGFNMFDTQFSVFYRRRLCKNLGVVAELFFGLSDIKNDLFFNSSLKERNKGAKLTLTYTIFK